MNNPTAVAIHEAKLLWPESPIQCVISFGTGRTIPNGIDVDSINGDSTNMSTWKNKFLKILDSATDTEGTWRCITRETVSCITINRFIAAVNTMLSDLLPSNVYYRFNPYLTEMLSMVEIDPVKIEQLQKDAVMYLRRNENKFHRAANTLLERKSSVQSVVDWLKLKRALL